MTFHLTGKKLHEYFHVQEDMHLTLTLVFVSSGIREGAIVNLTVGDYSTIECDKEKPAAGRLVVYSGEIYCFHKSRGMSCIR
jgi:hypothetical protein